MTSSAPKIFDAKNLNAMNFNTKEINGINYRINLFDYKDLKIKQILKGNKIRNKEDRLINLDQIKNILSDDDKTSEDEYSDNFSFDENDQDEKKENLNNMDFTDPDILVANKEQKLLSLPNQNWTHFIAIPFTKESRNIELVEKFNYFKNKILEEGYSDITDALFQIQERLHMTICMLELKSKQQVEKLQKVFKDVITPLMKDLIKEEDHVYTSLDSFEVFGKSHQSRVLYAKPKYSEQSKFLDILDIILSTLVENKFLNDDNLKSLNITLNQNIQRYEKEKLHLTLMNSTFDFRENAKENNNLINIQDIISGGNKSKKLKCFHGLRIIKKFNNFHFGTHPVNQICLYEMKIDNKTNNYKVVEEIYLKND